MFQIKLTSSSSVDKIQMKKGRVITGSSERNVSLQLKSKLYKIAKQKISIPPTI
jgi:hypothetical protein